ncbi:hypothetical protein QJS10_CPA01g01441 [Acorus calamus]|uniref:Reverse transcriptase domain-containing protein n=1 Tax=Acorus calamus TaxID=4465 RepID=A0AAV9FKS1_ACOCL|nr:hypothetical protein QJS10_CPA01g01441 [Acorus calamus]
MQKFRSTLGNNFELQGIPGNGHSGGIVTCWKQTLGIAYCPGQDQAVYLVVNQPHGTSWIVAAVYASPNSSIKKQLWLETSEVLNTNLPMFIAGDFNTLMDASDKKGGAPFRNSPEVRIFRDWFTHNGLHHVPTKGFQFTWCNNRSGQARAWERLDRAFANTTWMMEFPNAVVQVLPRYASDHAPLLLHTELPRPTGWKPFRFERFWLDYPEVEQIVKSKWDIRVSASPMGRIHHKLIVLQHPLREWNKQRVQDLPNKVREANVRLENLLQEEQSRGTSEVSMQQIQMAMNHLTALERQQEVFWAQRARTRWVTEGDNNSRFFHAQVQRRRAQNRITMLHTMDGVLLQTEEGIRQYTEAYFTEHWSTHESDLSPIPNEILQRRVPIEFMEELVKPFTEQEIDRVVHMLPSNKAPGPDGYPGEFYKWYWNYLKPDIIRALTHFHWTAELPISWGSTHVVLIPKKSNPMNLKDFRPISICDTKYKILSKVLVNRLKTVLPHLVGQEQGAFISGRSIHAHLLLVQDILHSLRRRPRSKALMAVKVDLASAYDSVEWHGLIQILSQFGFPSLWIKWMKACISMVRLAVIMNGTPTNWIPMGRGLRQGDPLSPYLFVLIAEVLSAQLRKEQRVGRILGYQPTPSLMGQSIPEGLTHILYADDLMIVAAATPIACSTLREVLANVQKQTGLTVSWGKSSIRFSPSVPSQHQRWMSRIVRMRPAPNSWKYLGVQVYGKGSIRKGAEIVYTKVLQKLEGWKAKCLTMAGRLQLLNSVIMAVPQHLILAAAMPTSKLMDIERMMRKFLWWNNSDVIEDGSWKIPVLESIFPEYWVRVITINEPPRHKPGVHATWCWEGTADLRPSLGQLIRIMRQPLSSPFQVDWKKLWKIPVVPKNDDIFSGNVVSLEGAKCEVISRSDYLSEAGGNSGYVIG